jgi:hypothetical protein
VKGPTVDTEAMYLHSVYVSTRTLRQVLARFTPPPSTLPTAAKAAASDTHSDPSPESPAPKNPGAQQDVPRQSRDPRHPLLNRDLDTGLVVKPGGYRLTDDTYADLLHRIAQQPKGPIPPEIKEDIEAYYADPNAPITTRKDVARWAQVQADLVTLKSIPASNEPEPYPTYGEDNDTPPDATSATP